MADDLKPSPSSSTDRRDAMWAQGTRLLGLMNGGAAVALLAFVQAIWTIVPELVSWIAASLIMFSFGLLFATAIPLLRAETVLRWFSEDGKTISDDGQLFMKLYRRIAGASVGMFVLGVVVVAVGIMANLPCTAE